MKKAEMVVSQVIEIIIVILLFLALVIPHSTEFWMPEGFAR